MGPTVRSNFNAVVWWPTSNMSRHRDWLTTWLRQTNPFIGYVCFTTSTEKSRILFVQPAMLKNSLDQRIEVMWRLGKAHHVKRLLPSQCGKTQMAYDIEANTESHRGLRWIQTFACCRPTIPQLLCCINFRFTTIAYISLVVIVFGSIARCIIFGVLHLPIRPCHERPPAMYGHFCLVPRVSVHDRYYCIQPHSFEPRSVWPHPLSRCLLSLLLYSFWYKHLIILTYFSFVIIHIQYIFTTVCSHSSTIPMDIFWNVTEWICLSPGCWRMYTGVWCDVWIEQNTG